MITDLFFSILLIIARAVLFLLPSWTPIDFESLQAGIAGFSSGAAWDWLAWLNEYFAIREALTATLAVLGVYVGVLLYRVLVDVLTKAHILGGSGD